MAGKSVFEQIKKQNGETFAKAVRAYDNGIFDIPEIVDIVKYVGRDAEPIMNYLVSLKNVQIDEHGVYQDPITLLDKAGYNAYYADTLEKQNAIQKYYAKGEKLCTFRDNNRYKKYHIINAVRKDVDKIKRDDFNNPKREDKYGTSVLSIQILKTGGFISIKNRYNHTVQNPDNTLNSNPDNIILGLSESLKHHLNVDFSAQKVSLPNHYTLMKNKIIHYNYEINNIYFGNNFYVKDGDIYELDKDKEIMMDYFIFNVKDKTIKTPVNDLSDSFPAVFENEIKGKKSKITKDKDGHHIFADDVEIAVVQDGNIKSLHLPTTKEIKDCFLEKNLELSRFSAPLLEKVGFDFLHLNQGLTELDLPNLKEVGIRFLFFNKKLSKLNAPLLEEVGRYFLYYNEELLKLNAPALKKVGGDFLWTNKGLRELDLPNLEEVGGVFLYHNEKLTELNLPNLEEVGFDFLWHNEELSKLNAPALEWVGGGFLCRNKGLRELDLPNLEEVGEDFLYYNEELLKLNAPALKKVRDRFLWSNKELMELDLPNLEEVGNVFLRRNEKLMELNLPNLKKVKAYFLPINKKLSKLNAPNLTGLEKRFPNLILEKDSGKSDSVLVNTLKNKSQSEEKTTVSKSQSTERSSLLKSIFRSFNRGG